jgi:hypothetical protein
MIGWKNAFFIERKTGVKPIQKLRKRVIRSGLNTGSVTLEFGASENNLATFDEIFLYNQPSPDRKTVSVSCGKSPLCSLC